MKRPITAQNVQIHTAVVSIRTLTVEGRQVTMGLFRQLIEEDIISWKTPVSLHGVAWGHVRYLIEDGAETAINIVWQKGNELRRCIVHKYASKWRLKDVKLSWLRERRYVSGKVFMIYTGIPSIPCRNPFVDIPNFNFRVAFEKKINGINIKYDEEVEEQYKIYEEKFEADFRAYRNRVHIACDQYEALVGPLFDLPQLFIAV
jgi:hypothetical protein